MSHVIGLQFLLKLQMTWCTPIHGHALPIFAGDLSADSLEWDIRDIARPATRLRGVHRYHNPRLKTNGRAIWQKNERARPPSGFLVTLFDILIIFHARAYRRGIQLIDIDSLDILPARGEKMVGDHFLVHTQFVGRAAAGCLTQNKHLAAALISSFTWRR